MKQVTGLRRTFLQDQLARRDLGLQRLALLTRLDLQLPLLVGLGLQLLELQHLEGWPPEGC